MSAIEKELLNATGIKAKRGENRQDYLARVIAAVEKLPDDEWDTLSTDSQDWTNEGAKAVNKSEEVADFPDLEDEPEEKAPEKEAKKKPASKSKSKSKPKEADAPKDKGGTEKKRDGIQVAIKKIMLSRPKISAAELSEILEERGYKISQFTVSTIRSDFRNSLKVMVEAGLIEMDV